MYAVIKTGGKQYKVAENDIIKIEKIEGDAGKNVKFDQVLAIGNGKTVEIGAPVVKGAVVSAEVVEQKKDDKVIVFKKKRRHNYRRKNGHRQEITIVRIMDVSGKGEVKKAAPKKAEAKKPEEKKEPAKKAEKKQDTPKKAEAKPATAKKTEAKKADTAKTTTKKED